MYSMYVDKLNDCERMVLVDLLMRLTRIDHTLDKNEMRYILDIHLKYEIKMRWNPNRSIADLCEEVMSNQSKLIILQELIRAARIDNRYCDKEKKFVKEISRRFDIGYDKYEELNRWVKHGIKWIRKGEDIISNIKPLDYIVD